MLITKFQHDVNNRYEVIRFFSLVINEACNLIKKYGKEYSLRTLDSLQFAFFKTYCEDDDIFVCADTRLVRVVELEGITTLVPE